MLGKSSPLAIFLYATALLMCTSLAQAQEGYVAGDEFTDSLRSGGNGPDMVVVPEGKYVFGGGRLGEDPSQLEVDILSPFAISKTEVTAGMYRTFLTATRSQELRTFRITQDNLPVTGLSWDQAESFVSWLSHQTGNHYRLPSSTEWEYAARAGSTGAYSWGAKVGKGFANCMTCGVSWQGNAAPVGTFEPNGWGIYDMHGNVWEWTKDCVDGNSQPPRNGMPQLFGNCESRELRGGSARSDAWSIRATARAFAQRKAKNNDVGLRVVMEVGN